MIEEMKIKYNCEEYEEPKCKKNKSSCFDLVIAILAALFIGIIGVIIGAALSSTILGALAAVIVLAVVLFILLSIYVILAICTKNKKKCSCR